MAKQTIEIETGLSDADRKLLNAINTKLDSLLGGKGAKTPAAGKAKPAPKVEEEDDFAADSTGGESDDGETDDGETVEDDDFGTEDETAAVTRAEVNASLAAFAKACDSKSKAFKLLEVVGGVKVLSELEEDKFAAVKDRADKETAKVVAAAKAKKGKK